MKKICRESTIRSLNANRIRKRFIKDKTGSNKNISRIDLWKIWKDVTAKPTPESSTAC